MFYRRVVAAAGMAGRRLSASVVGAELFAANAPPPLSRSLCPAPGGAAAQRLLRRLNGRFWAMPAAGPPCLPAQVFVIFARGLRQRRCGPLRGFLKVPRRRQTVPRRWRRWQGHVVDRLAPEGPSESMPPLRHRTSDARLDGGLFEISRGRRFSCQRTGPRNEDNAARRE